MSYISTRRIEIYPVGGNQKDIEILIKTEIRKQNRALNEAYSHLYFNYIAREKIKNLDEIYKEKVKEKEKKIADLFQILRKEKEKKEIIQKKIEKAKSDLNKLRKAKMKESFETLSQAIGIAERTQMRDIISHYDLMSDTKDRITAIVAADFTNDIKGILRGERSLRTYRANPLYIRGRSLTFAKDKRAYYINWRNKSTCFKVNLGRKPSLAGQVTSTLDNVIAGDYKVCDSCIQVKDSKMYVLLTIEHEKKEVYFDPKKVVGVDVGINVSAYCVLNTNMKIRKCIGDEKLLLDFKGKMSALRRKAQRFEKISSGSNGKLKKLKERESNFVKTYNHNISHEVIQFALKNNAGIIQMEKLSGKKGNNERRMNWAYFQLREMIAYKAAKHNIEVKYVPKDYTSLKCSACGNIDKENRYDKSDRTKFNCTKCGLDMHADYNAAMNIATSGN